MIKMTRREFVKLAAITGALTLVVGESEHAFKTLTAAQNKPQVKYVPNLCTMCVNRCGITAKVVNGRVVKLDGIPKHPANNGKICARGQSGVARLYNPDRIKAPMIRRDKSKRGTWEGFEEVDWSTALDEAAKRIKKYMDEGHPEKIAVISGWWGCAVYKPYITAFMQAIGTPNSAAATVNSCMFPGAFGWLTTLGGANHAHINADLENAKYIIALRRNLAGVGGVPHSWRFAEAKRRGAKVVVLDPRMSETAALADVWVPIRPGTDLAFLLAMGHVLVKEKLYDEAFLKKYTTAPLLLNSETGAPVKVWDDKATGFKKYLVYDLLQKKAVPHDEALDPALLGEYTVELEDGTTVKAKPAFQALADDLQQYTPEWASKICDVSAELIVKVAREFGRIKPAVIDPGWHDPRYENSLQTHRMMAILNAMVGNIDKYGGVSFNVPGREVDLPPPPQNRYDVMWGKKHGALPLPLPNYVPLYYAITKGDPYPIEMAIVIAGNPIRTWSGAKEWKEAFKKLNDVVVIDVLPQDTTMYADILLPDSVYLEKDFPISHVEMSLHGALETAVAAVNPVFNTKPELIIFAELTKRLGVYDKFINSLAKVLKVDADKLRSYFDSEGIRGIRRAQAEAYGISLDEIEKKGYVMLETKEELMGTMPYKKPLHTPSGKVEIYSLMLAQISSMVGKDPMWSPLPQWLPPKVMSEYEKNKAPNVFYFIYGKSPLNSYTHTTDNEMLDSLLRPEHIGVWINAKRAKQLGIKSGDKVKVTNLKTGEGGITTAFVTEAIREDTVFLNTQWGHESKKLRIAYKRGGVALNKLWPFQYARLIPGMLTNELLVKIEKV